MKLGSLANPAMEIATVALLVAVVAGLVIAKEALASQAPTPSVFERNPANDFDTLDAAGNNRPTGVWSDGMTMWVADGYHNATSGDNKIYAYDMVTRVRVPTKDFDTLSAAGNVYATGIWSDGTTMWVVDNVDGYGEKIYAYNMATKARVPAKDFNTLEAAGNDHPRGIWSDGATMWVVDDVDDRVYAYDMTTKARVPAKDFDTLADVGNYNAHGLWSDGTTMWVSDSFRYNCSGFPWPWTITRNCFAGKIYAYDMATKARVAAREFDTLSAAGNGWPTGIWSDGAVMWVADGTDDKIYVYNMPQSSSFPGTATVSDFARNPANDFALEDGFVGPSGIWSDRVTMWVADESDAKIYAYDMATRARLPDRDFNTLEDAGNDNPSDIWSDGTTVWVADYSDDKIYAYNMSTRARDSSKDFDTLDSAENESPFGIWSDRETMWVADYSDDKIYAYNMLTRARDSSKDFNTLDSNGNDNPQGIWSDGTTMLVADSRDDKIYAYNMLTRARDSSKDFDTLDSNGNDNPQGIWSDGEMMWVADESDSRIYAYDMGTKAPVAGREFDTLENESPFGIWSDRETMWVADESHARIYAYDMATRMQDSSKDFNTLEDAGNDNPSGIWSDGITMWVADYGDNKIYAYDMETKARVAARDFDTLEDAGNDNPSGIWSDGITMWVADYGDNKIYAYDMETKARVAARDFDALGATGNFAPQDLWSDGIAMWVTNIGVSAKIYSYDAATKARVPAWEFDTLSSAGNHSPTGIWSDEMTMWVVDNGDERIYAYNVPRASRVPVRQTRPGAPTGLMAAGNGQAQIDLSWSAPAFTGGAPITGYRVEVSANGSAWRDLEADTGTTSTSYSHAGLMAGSTRHYRVSAINSAGTGAASNVAIVTTATEVPGAPTGLTTEVSEDEAKVALSWTAPAFTGGVPITGYRIESSIDGNAPWTEVLTTTGEGTTYTDDGTDANGPMFSAGDWPHYRVAAVNLVGTGPFSEPRPAGGDSLVDRYDANGNGTIEKSEVIAAINDYLFGDADEAISKAEVIRLINLYLFGPSTPHNPPGAPTGLMAAGNGQTQIDLSWSAPTFTGGAPITGYRVEVSANGSAWRDLEADTGTTSTSYSHAGLMAESTRHYRVSAINSARTGPASNVAIGTTAGPPIISLGMVPPAPGSCGDGSFATPVQITGLVRAAKSPAWRPDCAEIAYLQYLDVSVMRPDGRSLRDLYQYRPGSSDRGAAKSVSWSPDGTKLAFAAENTGSGEGYWGSHIYVIDAGGSNRVQLTNGNQWDDYPSWSPDGNQIAFSRFLPGQTRIMTVDVDGSNETSLTSGSTREYSPSWSPDGASIAYLTEHGKLMLMASDGTNKREIVGSRAFRLGGVSWSPDSAQIAYTKDLGECTNVIVVNTDGTGARRIGDLAGDSKQPAWSPDGELLLFANSPVRGYSQIYIVSAQEGNEDGLEEGCAEVEPYTPNEDLTPADDWRSGFPYDDVPANSQQCRPSNPRPGHPTVGFPRPKLTPPVGKLRVAVLFVDFPDAVADYSTHLETTTHDGWVLNGTLATGTLATIENYLERMSYGKLDIELMPLHRWLRARHSLAPFLFEPGESPHLPSAVSGYINVEAVELALSDMDFSEVDVVVTVLPSVYFRGGLAAGAVQVDEKSIPTLQVGVFPPLGRPGGAPGSWGSTGAHELAHVLGLTDLYPLSQPGYGGGFAVPAAPADMGWVRVEAGLMGLQGYYLAPLSATRGIGGQSPQGMLAWSRWQIGWLEPEQVRCVTETLATVTLAAIDQPGDGVAMIAVPVGETEVIVIESRRDRGYDKLQLTAYDRTAPNNEGVLVYTVDSSLAELPIRFATDGGDGIMDQSPILPAGTSITVKGYEVTVTEDADDTHTVRVSKIAGGN